MDDLVVLGMLAETLYKAYQASKRVMGDETLPPFFSLEQNEIFAWFGVAKAVQTIAEETGRETLRKFTSRIN